MDYEPSAQDDARQRDQIAELEEQLKELQKALAEERRRRQEDRDSAATRERLLQAQLREVSTEAPVKQAPLPRVASLARNNSTPPGSQRGERSFAMTTPRTSDNLFVATPGESRSSPPLTPKGSRKLSSSGLQRKTSSPKRTSPVQEVKHPETALQHSWNKFCVRARGEFTPHELALVSAETLENLLAHYGFTSAVEKAQVEAQWALLQEGKDAAENFTARAGSKSERGSLRFPNHPKDFVVEVNAGGPHLSRRTPLRREASRSGNPNETTSASGQVRTTSATRVLTPRKAASSDPNETQTRTSPWRSCVGPADSPPERPAPSHGMKHVVGPSTGEFTPRGIRSSGNTAMGGDAVKPEGRKIVKEQHEVDSGKRGIRTFDRDGSPTQIQRPSKIVSTPPHVERSHLATETLIQSANRPPPKSSTSDTQQKRTPFALDPPAVQSANSRARR